MVLSKSQMTETELFNGTRKMLKSYVLTEKDRNEVDKLKQDLLELAGDLYPDDNVEAHLFGSRLTGLASSKSDVDIYLDIGKTFDGSISEDIDEQGKRVEKFQKGMKRRENQLKFKVIGAVKTSRVPILTFEHLSTRLKCDISFRSGMSTRNGELVKFYLDWDPKVKFVVIGVKFFMQEHGLADSQRFSSYAQVWLALFFLMQPGIELIPPLVCLRQLATQKRLPVTESIVEYWNCTVPKVCPNWQKRWTMFKCNLSEEELLKKFFTFYSSLLPLENKFVLTTYNGMKTVKKRVFGKKPRNPIRVFKVRYSNEKGSKKLSAIQEKYKKEMINSFYLQDPFFQFKNLTRMSSVETSNEQMAEFAKCCKAMEKELSE